MKTKGDFKEMPKYSPYAYFHRDHFDVVLKVKVNDTYKVKQQLGTKENDLEFQIIIKSKKQKYSRHEIVYINKISLPGGIKPEAKITITVVPDPDNLGTEPGGTTVVRYGDIPPTPGIK
jgi:hypothetical protein